MKCASTARYAPKDTEILGENPIRKQRKNLHPKKMESLLKIEQKLPWYSIFGILPTLGCCSCIWNRIRHAFVKMSTGRFYLAQLIILLKSVKSVTGQKLELQTLNVIQWPENFKVTEDTQGPILSEIFFSCQIQGYYLI